MLHQSCITSLKKLNLQVQPFMNFLDDVQLIYYPVEGTMYDDYENLPGQSTFGRVHIGIVLIHIIFNSVSADRHPHRHPICELNIHR